MLEILTAAKKTGIQGPSCDVGRMQHKKNKHPTIAPYKLKTQRWYIRTFLVPKPLVSSTKEASRWCTSWQVTQSKPLKSVQASSKKLQNRIKQGNNEFLIFTPRLAWVVPKFNTTSKQARTGGASYIDKNRIKGTISYTAFMLANLIIIHPTKKPEKRNYTNILSRVYRCVSNTQVMQQNYWISNPKKHNKNETNPKDPKPTINFQCVPPPRTPPLDVAPRFDNIVLSNLVMLSSNL